MRTLSVFTISVLLICDLVFSSPVTMEKNEQEQQPHPKTDDNRTVGDAGHNARLPPFGIGIGPVRIKGFPFYNATYGAEAAANVNTSESKDQGQQSHPQTEGNKTEAEPRHVEPWNVLMPGPVRRPGFPFYNATFGHEAELNDNASESKDQDEPAVEHAENDKSGSQDQDKSDSQDKLPFIQLGIGPVRFPGSPFENTTYGSGAESNSSDKRMLYVIIFKQGADPKHVMDLVKTNNGTITNNWLDRANAIAVTNIPEHLVQVIRQDPSVGHFEEQSFASARGI